MNDCTYLPLLLPLIISVRDEMRSGARLAVESAQSSNTTWWKYNSF